MSSDTHPNENQYSLGCTTKVTILHSTPNDETVGNRNGMEHFVYAHGSIDSRGLALLIKNQVNYDIFEKYSSEGRILLIQLRI